jgi:hypothetical protein
MGDISQHTPASPPKQYTKRKFRFWQCLCPNFDLLHFEYFVYENFVWLKIILFSYFWNLKLSLSRNNGTNGAVFVWTLLRDNSPLVSKILDKFNFSLNLHFYFASFTSSVYINYMHLPPSTVFAIGCTSVQAAYKLLSRLRNYNW